MLQITNINLPITPILTQERPPAYSAKKYTILQNHQTHSVKNKMSRAEIHIIYQRGSILSPEQCISLWFAWMPTSLLLFFFLFSISLSFSLSLSLFLCLLAAIPVAGRACSKYVTECVAGTLGALILGDVIGGWGCTMDAHVPDVPLSHLTLWQTVSAN